MELDNIKELMDMGSEEHILAYFLLDGTIFINNGWWYKEEGKQWPEDRITIHVNCNDVFAWGTADSEDITYSELKDLYEFVKKDPNLGSSAWCIKKRKQMPQKPLEEMFKKAKIWDLEDLIK